MTTSFEQEANSNEKIRNDIKTVTVVVIISCISVVISAINLVYSSMNGLQIGTSITLICCNLCIMCVCISSLANRKKQNKGEGNDNQTRSA